MLSKRRQHIEILFKTINNNSNCKNTKKNLIKILKMIKKCLTCEIEFHAFHGNRRYCCAECRPTFNIKQAPTFNNYKQQNKDIKKLINNMQLEIIK